MGSTSRETLSPKGHLIDTLEIGQAPSLPFALVPSKQEYKKPTNYSMFQCRRGPPLVLLQDSVDESFDSVPKKFIVVIH